LLDVARVAGVSPSTVSRILNGTAKVSEVKRKAVLAAIEAMIAARTRQDELDRAYQKGRDAKMDAHASGGAGGA
jgi:LacI family transcriptional regulator